MVSDATGLRSWTRERILGKEAAQTRVWGMATFQGLTEEEESAEETEKTRLGGGRKARRGASQKAQAECRRQGGPQGQVSHKSILWDWQLGVSG